MGFWKKAACVTAAGAAALGFSYTIKAMWPEQTDYYSKRYVQQVLEREEILSNNPVLKPFKNVYDWLAVNVHGQASSYEELEAKRRILKHDLDAKIKNYEQKGE